MSGRRQKRFNQLDLQMEAITDAMIMASQEPDPERRAERLAVVERAFGVYHREHRAVLARPILRALPGGAAVVAAGVWSREMWGAHRLATVGAAVAATALGAVVLLIGPWRGQLDEQQAPAPAPTATAPPSPETSSPAPSESAPPGSSPPPSPSPTASGNPTASASAAPSAPPASWETPIADPGSTPPTEPPEPGPGRGTDPVVPPGLDEDEDRPGDGEGRPDRPPRPERERCVLAVDVPVVDIGLGGLLCL